MVNKVRKKFSNKLNLSRSDLKYYWKKKEKEKKWSNAIVGKRRGKDKCLKLKKGKEKDVVISKRPKKRI